VTLRPKYGLRMVVRRRDAVRSDRADRPEPALAAATAPS
jgi:hypothetical protein